MSGEHVLVRGDGVAPDQCESLARAIAAGGPPVVIGEEVGGFPSYAHTNGAAALLLLLGSHPSLEFDYTTKQFIQEAAVAVALLDARASLPSELAAVPKFDLSDWPDGPNNQLAELRTYLIELWHQHEALPLYPSLSESIQSARDGVDELNELVDQFIPLRVALADSSRAAQLLNDTLQEISATYRVVKEAVASFIAPSLDTKQLDGGAYVRLRHGVLRQAINSGRGHCLRIGTRYDMLGGLRDHVKTQLSPEQLQDLDETFETLANADGDVFAAMDNLGDALTHEAGAVVRLLLAGREDSARQRVTEAYEALLPLELLLDDATAKLTQIALDLGYAEDVVTKDRTVVHGDQTHITTHIGSITGSQVAIGQIDHVKQQLQVAPISEELKSLLDQLANATRNLAAHLPAGEADLAADDLETLTAEAQKENPRFAFVRRAADGLLAAAKKVSEVGTPVVELVTRVVALTGSA